MASTQSSTTKAMLGTLAGIVGSGTAMSLGSSYGTEQGAWLLLWMYCAVFVPLGIGGLIAEKRNNKEQKHKMLAQRNSLTAITQKYNAVTEMLEWNYEAEKRKIGIFSSGEKERLRQYYEQEYYKNRAAFEQERNTRLTSFTDASANTKLKTYWKWVFALGIIAQFSACGYSMGALTESEVTTTTATSQEVRYWTAENVPMPHLIDGSRYVSNPDNVVSAETEQKLNQILKKMDDSLQIESAMIIVNHVENKDIFRFSQDLFDKYKIGKNNRGLVVALAYEDHQIRTHTGRSLEGDLTDVECSRLQQTYAIPAMKAEQPDSGMLYLTEAIYNTLQNKDLPVMSSLKADNTERYSASTILLFYALLLGGWCGLGSWLARRYSLMTGLLPFRPNPFAKRHVAIVSGGGFGGGGFGGGFGGFSGGSFGGGSSGGGGATSSW